ncbi:BnaA09g08040D [Brassica napus]|uniref:Alpha-mannosidase n=1 Tax=Brassica napus TaxID=3708 RepID=A0A078G005_BRANA|nr:BnaA09g08040D [Brassica napus]
MVIPGLSLLICVIVSVTTCLSFKSVNGVYVKYGTEARVVPDKLNVHLVPHSHDDVGWLKTVDQYFIGSNNSIQKACVRNVMDSVMDSLRRDPNRKFVFAEMAFFTRWWGEQNPETHEQVKKLVNSGQLEFVNGGWSMNDEATCHYIDMIDQMTLGHRFIMQTFNITPRAAWQIDPFGHSSVQAYLMGAELGFDSLHFARIDYQDREKRKDEKSLEFVWRGSETFASSSQIFTNTFPVHYSPPSGFHYEITDDYAPLQDDPLLDAFNIKDAVDNFVNASLFYANVTRGNHVMWTMGDDFQYQFAESWFRQMDRLIHYVNKDGRVNAVYSTPSLYVDAKNAAKNITWPLKTHDFFPYADRDSAYWTGYFTSRPAFKRYVRSLSGYYLAARQLEFLVGKKSGGPNTFRLGDALAIAQHHDGVTGTAKQHVTNDYAKRLAHGASEAEAVVNSALAHLMNKARTKPDISLAQQCSSMNMSYCPVTEETISGQKSLILVAYNSLAWNRTEVIRIPVNDAGLNVEDSSGKTLDAQYIPMDNVTSNLRSNYSKAYLGVSSQQIPKYWLVFKATVPPLGWNTFFISKEPGKGSDKNKHSPGTFSPMKGITEIGPGNLKLVFSPDSGLLKQMHNSRTGANILVDQNYLWYASNVGDSKNSQVSGAYIFRPNASLAYSVSSKVSFSLYLYTLGNSLLLHKLQIVRGPLVDEVHQQFSPWVSQVIRVYKDKEHAEFEYTIGPLPVGKDYVGKEVITRMVANMSTDKTFYTDSNGRDFLKRVRDNRTDWTLKVNEPIAGNYYPLNLGMYTKDKKVELSVLVDRATGGGSIKDGELELMLHRRTCMDDSRGVEESLEETVCINGTCTGLTVRGNYYVSINTVGGEGARWRRGTGQEIYTPLLMAFTHENKEKWKGSNSVKGNAMDPHYAFPPNVALITLEELDLGNVLLRLAHLYEAGEESEYSKVAKVELKKLFPGKTIKGVKEMSLVATQEKAKMKEKMKWKVEGEAEQSQSSSHPQKGGPLDSSALVVELAPMEIRTFLLQFSQKQPAKQQRRRNGGVRPFGLSTLIVGFDPYSRVPSLYQTDPSGTFSAWKANATGRNSNSIREFLEKNFKETSGQETVKLAIRALLEVVESGGKNIEVAVMTREESGLRQLEEGEIDAIVAEIEAEKAAAEAAKKGPQKET